MSISPKMRQQVLKRDNYICQYCGKKANPEHYVPDRGLDYVKYDVHGVVLNVDHVIPLVKGGRTILINLKASCFECNQNKKDKSLTEWKKGKHAHLLIQINI